MASLLVRSSADRAVQVRALAGDIVLCSWERHFTLTVPLSSYRVRTGHGKPGKSEFLISISRPGKSWNSSEGHGKSWKSNMLLEKKKAQR